MLTLFYSSAYWAGTPDFDTFRKSEWIVRRLACEPRSFVRLDEPTANTIDLETVHAPAYVAAVKSGRPSFLAGSNGLEWTPGLYAAARSSSLGAAEAALRALNGETPAGSLSAGLHHARTDRGAGYCTFNGLALAARAAIDTNAGAILILDLDAHFGGGTWSIVSGWQEVWQADVSVADFDRYDPMGHPRAIVEWVTDASRYLDTIRGVLDRLSAVPVDLVIYNAGMDPYEGCDTGGLRGVTKEMLNLREELVFDWTRSRGVPVAFVLAGGYTGPRLSRDDLVDLHLLTIDAANPGRSPRS